MSSYVLHCVQSALSMHFSTAALTSVSGSGFGSTVEQGMELLLSLPKRYGIWLHMKSVEPDFKHVIFCTRSQPIQVSKEHFFACQIKCQCRQTIYGTATCVCKQLMFTQVCSYIRVVFNAWMAVCYVASFPVLPPQPLLLAVQLRRFIYGKGWHYSYCKYTIAMAERL